MTAAGPQAEGCVAVFYHLTRSPVDRTLQQILPRALAQGWSVMVRGTSDESLRRLDDRLWLDPEDGFLPHGMAGGPHDAAQPVLLGTGAIGNGARGLALIDGAQPMGDELAGLSRLWVLFDGADPAATDNARGLWARLAALDHSLQYWSESEGRWSLQRERAKASSG